MDYQKSNRRVKMCLESKSSQTFELGHTRFVFFLWWSSTHQRVFAVTGLAEKTISSFDVSHCQGFTANRATQIYASDRKFRF